MTAQIRHEELDTVFTGIEDKRYGEIVHHYRGIPYAQISARFQSPQPISKYGSLYEATTFGPQCVQPRVDFGHLMRLPVSEKYLEVEEDEFACLNLNISKPFASSTSPGLPVIIWIHGGSQCVTFASAAASVCDPTRFVAESATHAKPVIFVTFNYRLNVFAFGDGKGEVNLALQDQRQLLHWVAQNIRGFGGDPNNITLAGESAGAVYTHAHMVSGAQVRRAILASGSLNLSPPLPREHGNQLISRLEDKLPPESNLRTAPASAIIDALAACKINSMWLQEEESLLKWKERVNFPQPLIIGDVEFESIIWRQGIEDANVEDLERGFDAAGQAAAKLKETYHFNSSRPTQSKHAVLDFLHDCRFGLPVYEISTARFRAGQKTYRYIFDEPNPWQSSSRAHHAVDLISIFGGIDLTFNPGANSVGKALRRTWIDFAHGLEPWPADITFAFGPHGEFKSLTNDQLKVRRRLNHYKVLCEIGLEAYNPAFAKLAAGRISLNN